jgi:hypothetical protein
MKFSIFSIKFTAFAVLFFLVSMQISFYLNYESFNAPMIELEFVNNSSDVENIIGSPENPNIKMINALLEFNQFDFGFMFAYSGFLFMIFFNELRKNGKKIFLIGILFPVIALIFDFFENFQLNSIMQKTVLVEDFSLNIDNLKLFTWIKWFSLAFSFGFLIMKYGFENNRIKLLNLLLTIPVIIGLIAFYTKNFQIENTFVLSIFACFGYFIILAIFKSKVYIQNKLS